MIRIPYVNLSAQWREEREELQPIVESVLESGQYIGGDEVESFETEAATAFGISHVVSLNSGTDALSCGLAAIGVRPGDEVITPPNSFIASTAAIVHIGARPVFVDVGPDQLIDSSLIEGAITKRTKAIMPVHLSGRMADMHNICKIAGKYGLAIVEDAAQAAGSCLEGRPAGSWGDLGCFSAHPLKNLNACGDAGFIITNNDDVAGRVRFSRNHGLVGRETVEKFGHVSRMDALQAAILRYRLGKLSHVVERRKRNVKEYDAFLNHEFVLFPRVRLGEKCSWHTLVIQVNERDRLRKHLSDKGIETAIHYPVPIHLQPAAADLGYKRGDFPMTEQQAARILTLPVHQFLTKREIVQVANEINRFFQ
jgi:dTDP-4-amino-4,6-dideoxygalactose transaminase